MKIMTAKQYWAEQIERNETSSVDLQFDQTVLEIIAEVRARGDEAIKEFSMRFDGADLQQFVVSQREIDDAYQLVTKQFLQALRVAKANIFDYHKEQKERSWFMYKEHGVMLGQQVSPLQSVGIYVPGGKAAYPSTALMNAIPAKIAGVDHVSMTTPPQADGSINPHILVAAAEAGVDVIYKVGGAQAIAALAYGTETIRKVVKITGPGNAYVARAKKWVFGDVAIDMIAGPSEICVVADDKANPSYIAADLLSQAEHDERAAAVCVTTSAEFAKRLVAEVQQQLEQMERVQIAQQSIDSFGRIVIVESVKEALQFVNELAPEHLQLMIDEPQAQLPFIRNAGAIFIGNYSPEALGDYVAGPNHTLPTSGTAAFSSPLGVYDFMKKSSIIQYTKEAFELVANDIVTLANAEQLEGHAKSILIRKEDNS